MFTYNFKEGINIHVDDEDKDFLFNYHINTLLNKGSYTRYVVCKFKGTDIHAGMLHRLILNIKDRNILVDHNDGNGLNCIKSNLRICKYFQNQQNRRLTKIENEVRGLYFRKDRGYWTARITVNKKVILLGSFINKEDAIIARLNAENEYFSEFNGIGTTNVQL